MPKIMLALSAKDETRKWSNLRELAIGQNWRAGSASPGIESNALVLPKYVDDHCSFLKSRVSFRWH